MEYEVKDDYLTVYEPNQIHQIPLGALATWGELLEYDDIIDVVDAIIHKDHLSLDPRTTPEPDPETGENTWTEVIRIKRHLEQLREEEAWKQIEGKHAEIEFAEARAAGDIPAQKDALRTLRRCDEARKADCPKEYSAQKVREEVYRLSGGECEDSETILAKCAQRARDLLGVPDPECVPCPERTVEMSCDEKPHTTECVTTCPKTGELVEKRRTLDSDERFKCRAAFTTCDPCDVDCKKDCDKHCKPGCSIDHLTERLEWIKRRRLQYCHQLSEYAHDPLADEYTVAEVAKKAPGVEEIMTRHRGGETG